MDSAVKFWLDRAVDNIRAARHCRGQGHCNAAANRAYYAVLHAAAAHLMANGRRHEIERSPGQYEHGKIVANLHHVSTDFETRAIILQSARNKADYWQVLLDGKQVDDHLKDAGKLVDNVARELKDASA